MQAKTPALHNALVEQAFGLHSGNHMYKILWLSLALVFISCSAQVTLDFTAHDKKGNPVLDLEPTEVQVVDGGAPVALSNLQLASPGPASITLVFDQVVPGVGKTDQGLAEEFVTAAAGHGYLFTVLKVEGRLHLVQAPTADIEAVKQAVAAATVANRPDYIRVTEGAEKQITADMQSASGARQATAKRLMAMLMESQNTIRDPQFTSSVAALLAASRGQQDVPGRKTILYFSQGLDWRTSTPETLRDIVRAANRARVSIHSFDSEIGDAQAANALVTSSAVGTSQAMGNIATGSLTQGRNATPSAVGPGMGAQANEYTGRLQSGEGAVNSPKSLAGICAGTGGLHVEAMTGDARRGAGEIAAELNLYYVASWVSPGSGDENQLRPIRVQSLRKGVIIDAAAGYYPTSVKRVEAGSAGEQRLLAALASPDLPTDLPVNAAVLQSGSAADSDPDSVLLQAPATAGPGKVSVLALLKDSSGAVVRKFSADVPAGKDMTTFRRQFSAPPGDYVLESAAMDSNAGKIGARRDNVTIAPAGAGPSLGTVLLVERIDPAGSAPETDPLRCTKGIVVPNLSGRLSKADNAQITLFFSIHPNSASTELPSLSAELRRDGALIGSLPLKLSGDMKRKTIPYLTSIGAGSLSEGQYEMTVILSQGEQKASQSVSFTLE